MTDPHPTDPSPRDDESPADRRPASDAPPRRVDPDAPGNYVAEVGVTDEDPPEPNEPG